ncbi:MAG TPA: BACON domain-containing carbohydrate-binding protein [Bryobacteraceae bacterium]|jgi:uncharacterized protein (TIGR03437 family)
MRALLLLAAVAPLAAQCTYQISPTTVTAGAPGMTSQINVQTSADNCIWKYGADVTWITFSGAATGQITGSGPLVFTVAPNPDPSPSQRTGNIAIVGTSANPFFTQVIAVTQTAPVCTLSFQPATASVAVNGGSGTISLQTNCRWSTNPNASWLTLTPRTGIPADAPINYTAVANPCVAQRVANVSIQSASVFIPPQTFQLTQAGSPNNLSLSPATLAADSTETTGRVAVTTATGCGWSAFSDVSWLQITAGSSGTGNGTIAFKAIANTGPQRVGSIHVGTQTFTVTQQAIAVTPVSLTVLKNAASYTQGSVSPGEIVALGGSNLGPVQGIGLQLTPDGVAKTLGGTRVLFDGAAAALTYSSANQVNAVVPYSLRPGATTQIQVEYQGALSNTMSMPVQASTPGIFTIDASGLGSGAILNQDYQVNAPATAAVRGQVIMIYCTGGGVTNPPSVDGSVTGLPLPNLTLPVTVTIGGLNADVGYKGGAPTTVAGLTQINAVVPSGVTPGPAVPVLVTIGGVQSQPGVTVSVK